MVGSWGGGPIGVVLGLVFGEPLGWMSASVLGFDSNNRKGIASAANAALCELSEVFGIALLGAVVLGVLTARFVRRRLAPPTEAAAPTMQLLSLLKSKTLLQFACNAVRLQRD